ncbi:MAG: radical SAM protein, partial [Candidatus Methylomirabilis sp.]|nr:radical SAM protein [Deltaproteobacteria bacterium]
DRPAVEDLDALPFPIRPAETVMKHHDWHIFGMRKPYITMITPRGCPFDCTFCTSPVIWGHKVRRRSVDNVLAEIDHEVETNGVRYIGFKDDIFGTSVEWTREFCEKLIARPYKVRWSAMVHPFSFKKERDWIVPLMARAGLDILIPGLQSVDAGVLTNISRDPREPYELAEMLRIAQREGVSTVLQFIFGLPGDSEATMDASLRYALAVRPNYAQFYRLSFLEGAELERQFPRQDPTEFPPEEIERRVARAQRRFYTHPAVLARNLAHVLRKNPRWLLVAARHAGYILAAAGFPIGVKADPC